MRSIARRLSSLTHLARPLALTFIGIVLLSLGVAYLFIHFYRTVDGLPPLVSLLTLQFMPRIWRGILLFGLGFGVIFAGIWQLSGMVVIPIAGESPDGELVLGYQRTQTPPRVVVLSGGAGMLILGSMSEHVQRMTCIVPVQDPVEYYYRASGLFHFQNIYYVVPTPVPVQVSALLDDQTRLDIRHIDMRLDVAPRHVDALQLQPADGLTPERIAMTRLALDAIREADAIVLGPGSLFESVLPNFLIDEFRAAVASSSARKIYICNLMTEPGRTTGFGVAEHIRAIKQYAGITPDYVLVNAQRIDPEVYRLYAAAHQSPVYLDPDEYEETAVLPGDQVAQRRVLIEGAMVIEADLASSVIQYTASLDKPIESRAVRVLRHDGQKLTAAILELLRRT
ncbi:MAG: hypothetical protein HC822_19215 [Oscillochloris sp.]|nr:hypothetical protein [Oscillochloris sp.]